MVHIHRRGGIQAFQLTDQMAKSGADLQQARAALPIAAYQDGVKRFDHQYWLYLANETSYRHWC